MTLRIGALAPLSEPGWAHAGANLIAGLELGAKHANGAGGVDGQPLELLIRDTAADPLKAAAAVAELAGLGVVALAGEYHSVVARTAATAADAFGLPFLCSSAVLDSLTEEPSDWVARLAPPQSRGWAMYAEHLLAAGHRRVAVVSQPGAYWQAGSRLVGEALRSGGGTVVALSAASADGLCDELVGSGATALLLLVGHPEPAVSIVRSVRRDPRLKGVLLGAPAGQPELVDWAASLGGDGAGVPFLRYMPERLGALGSRVEDELRVRLGSEPSFVALEGYDTIMVLASLLRFPARDGAGAGWDRVDVQGTRGRIRFTRVPGVSTWQWAWPPMQVVERHPADPSSLRVLASA